MNSLPPEDVQFIVKAAKRFTLLKAIVAGAVSGLVTVFGAGWYLRGQISNIATKDDIKSLSEQWKADSAARETRDAKQDERLNQVEKVAAVAEFCCSTAHPVAVPAERVR